MAGSWPQPAIRMRWGFTLLAMIPYAGCNRTTAESVEPIRFPPMAPLSFVQPTPALPRVERATNPRETSIPAYQDVAPPVVSREVTAGYQSDSGLVTDRTVVNTSHATVQAPTPGTEDYLLSSSTTPQTPVEVLPRVINRQPPSERPVASSRTEAFAYDRQLSATGLLQQAGVEHQRGVTLATRGSLFVARGKFTHALLLLSQAADAQTGTRRHEAAFDAALRALEEAEDFIDRRPSGVARPDLAVTIRAHQTRAVTLEEAPHIATSEASLRYLHFARTRLQEAFSESPAASQTLHAVGRAYDMLAGHSSVVAAEDKARVFYETALAVDPGNAAVANDLGVLLAKYGRLAEARALLMQSVSRRPNPSGYHNLAVVHERLGETGLAAQARQSAASVSGSAAMLANPTLLPWQNVQWVDTATFSQTSQLASDPHPTGKSEESTNPLPPPMRPAERSDTRAAARWQQ